jgi:hypothetical protein
MRLRRLRTKIISTPSSEDEEEVSRTTPSVENKHCAEDVSHLPRQ